MKGKCGEWRVWVLILFLQNGYAGGVISQEFNSKEKCEAAAVDNHRGHRFSYCVEK